jgi:hypothetical protein
MGGGERWGMGEGWWLGKRYAGCWVLWPLCVFGCISVVVVEGVCVRDCRGAGVVWSWYSWLVSRW